MALHRYLGWTGLRRRNSVGSDKGMAEVIFVCWATKRFCTVTKQKSQRSILIIWGDAVLTALAFVISLPLTLPSGTFLRGHCPHCQRRGLCGVLCNADPALTGDTRPFFLSECDYCHHQFWRFQGKDQTIIHITPTDQRYTRAT